MRKIVILFGIETELNPSEKESSRYCCKKFKKKLQEYYGYSGNTDFLVYLSNNKRVFYSDRGNYFQQDSIAAIQLNGRYDLAIIVYSGMGFYNSQTQERFLADLSSTPKRLDSRVISMDCFNRWVKEIPAANKLVVIDASWIDIVRRNNYSRDSFQERSYSQQDWSYMEPLLNDMEADNIAWMQSCPVGNTSYRTARTHRSIFFEYLCLALQQGQISAQKICNFVCRQTQMAVMKEHRALQKPTYSFWGTQDILLTDEAVISHSKERLYSLPTTDRDFRSVMLYTLLTGIIGVFVLYCAFPALFTQFAVTIANSDTPYALPIQTSIENPSTPPLLSELPNNTPEIQPRETPAPAPKTEPEQGEASAPAPQTEPEQGEAPAATLGPVITGYQNLKKDQNQPDNPKTNSGISSSDATPPLGSQPSSVSSVSNRAYTKAPIWDNASPIPRLDALVQALTPAPPRFGRWEQSRDSFEFNRFGV